MAFNRSNSPDKYLRMTKNLQDRVLTKEEKLMLLNVYGVLRKKFSLTEFAAATKAADLCGVSTRALLSAKSEFGISNISLPSEPSKKCIPPEKTLEQQPSYRVYSLVKTKILELYKKGVFTTMESVIEAFRKDPQLPHLEDSAIIQVIRLLNLTPHLAPASNRLQNSNKDPSFKALAYSPENPTFVRNTKAIAHRNAKVDDECCIVYCQSDGSDAGDTDPLQLLEVKTDKADTDNHISNEKIEDLMVVVKCEVDKECRPSDRTPSNLDGIFPNRPTDSELQESAVEYCNSEIGNILQFGSSQSNHSNSDAFLPIVRCTLMASEAKTVNSNVSKNNITGIDTYTFATENQQLTSLSSVGLKNTSQPYAGILVYGLNETSIPNSFSFGTNTDSPSNLHYINSVSTDDSSNSTGIFRNSQPELTNENVANSLFVSSVQSSVDSVSTSVTRPDTYASLPENITSQLANPGAAIPQSRRKILRKLSRKRRNDKWCNLCLRSFDTRGSVCEHLSAGRKPFGEGSLTCKYCLKDFPKHTAEDFIQHLMYMHTMTSLKCDFCLLLFGDAQNLVQHVVECHKMMFLKQQGFPQA